MNSESLAITDFRAETLEAKFPGAGLVRLTWRTNLPADGRVMWSRSQFEPSSPPQHAGRSPVDPALTTEHSVVINWAPTGRYFVAAESLAGNTGQLHAVSSLLVVTVAP